MAGHSKWANIKHRKARQDNLRGKMWSKCSRAIITAARAGGGDPDTNISLRYAIDEAKAANMPKDTIEKAIKKGSGELTSENYEAVTYEGYGPNGVAVFIESLTDNRNRTAGEIRSAFDKNGGNLGTAGSVSYIFARRGLLTIPKARADEETIMNVALEAGALDVADDGDLWEIQTEPAGFQSVRTALESAGLTPQSAELTMIASNTVECTGEIARRVLRLIDVLDDNDDVQKVHTNAEISEEVLASLE